jgi:hypothetical protein
MVWTQTTQELLPWLRTSASSVGGESAVTDNKSRRGKQDRSRISSGEAYEVGYFARKHRISKDQAEKIIRQARGSHERANALAERAA